MYYSHLTQHKNKRKTGCLLQAITPLATSDAFRLWRNAVMAGPRSSASSSSSSSSESSRDSRRDNRDRDRANRNQERGDINQEDEDILDRALEQHDRDRQFQQERKQRERDRQRRPATEICSTKRTHAGRQRLDDFNSESCGSQAATR